MFRKRRRPLVYTSPESVDIDDAIGNSFRDHRKPLYTKCRIIAHLGSQCAQVREGYRWDGASIPWWMWSLMRLDPKDIRSMLASMFHDYGCEDDKTPQVMADALFVALLGPMRFNGYPLSGVGKWRARAMYMAVRLYSMFIRKGTRLWP